MADPARPATGKRGSGPTPAELRAPTDFSQAAASAGAGGPRTALRVSAHKRPAELDGRLVLLAEPDSARAACFRVLRHRLADRGDPKAIVVTSAAPREGKTTCAVNLALALGECGRARVLLIEANQRSPELAQLFGFMPPECFADQLARHRERPLEPWTVVEVYEPWLHVAAMRPQTASRPLLDAPAFAVAMERLRLAGYDYIVLDTPPILGSADVNLIEDSADGVLLVTSARKTMSRPLRRALEQLAPARLLGLVLLDA